MAPPRKYIDMPLSRLYWKLSVGTFRPCLDGGERRSCRRLFEGRAAEKSRAGVAMKSKRIGLSTRRDRESRRNRLDENKILSCVSVNIFVGAEDRVRAVRVR
jgi:hypothetical protein